MQSAATVHDAFLDIGSSSNDFTGEFEGTGYTIDGLIVSDRSNYVDRDDVRSSIRNQAAAQAVLAKLDALGMK